MNLKNIFSIERGEGAEAVRSLAKSTNLGYFYLDRYMVFTVKIVWRL